MFVPQGSLRRAEQAHSEEAERSRSSAAQAQGAHQAAMAAELEEKHAALLLERDTRIVQLEQAAKAMAGQTPASTPERNRYVESAQTAQVLSSLLRAQTNCVFTLDKTWRLIAVDCFLNVTCRAPE